MGALTKLVCCSNFNLKSNKILNSSLYLPYSNELFPLIPSKRSGSASEIRTIRVSSDRTKVTFSDFSIFLLHTKVEKLHFH